MDSSHNSDDASNAVSVSEPISPEEGENTGVHVACEIRIPFLKEELPIDDIAHF